MRPEGWGWLFNPRRQGAAAAQDAAGNLDAAPARRQIFEALDEPLRQALADVEDDTPLSAADYNVVMGILAVLDAIDPGDARGTSSGVVACRQLHQQPDAYRGEMLTSYGVVRRVFRVEAPENDQGIAAWYETWIEPPEGASPLVVFCLELPAGFPTGTDLAEPVAVHGVAFKTWVYQAADRDRSAPVIVARTLAWEPPREMQQADDTMPAWQMVAIGAAVALVFVAAVFIRTRRREAHKAAGLEPPDWEKLRSELENPSRPPGHASGDPHASV
jgi:hypothetical protein